MTKFVPLKYAWRTLPCKFPKKEKTRTWDGERGQSEWVHRKWERVASYRYERMSFRAKPFQSGNHGSRYSQRFAAQQFFSLGMMVMLHCEQDMWLSFEISIGCNWAPIRIKEGTFESVCENRIFFKIPMEKISNVSWAVHYGFGDSHTATVTSWWGSEDRIYCPYSPSLDTCQTPRPSHNTADRHSDGLRKYPSYGSRSFHGGFHGEVENGGWARRLEGAAWRQEL